MRQRALVLLLVIALGVVGQTSSNCSSVPGAMVWPLNTACGGAGICTTNSTCKCLPGVTGANDLVYTTDQCLTNELARVVLAVVGGSSALAMVGLCLYKLRLYPVFKQRGLVYSMLALYSALAIYAGMVIYGWYLVNSIPMMVVYLISQLAMLTVTTYEHLAMAYGLYDHWENDLQKQDDCKKAARVIFLGWDVMYFNITVGLLVASFVLGDSYWQFVLGSLHVAGLALILGWNCFFGVIHYAWLVKKLNGVNPGIHALLFDNSNVILVNFARFTISQCGMLLCVCVCIFVPTWYGCAFFIMHLVGLCSDAYWLASIRRGVDGNSVTSSFGDTSSFPGKTIK